MAYTRMVQWTVDFLVRYFGFYGLRFLFTLVPVDHCHLSTVRIVARVKNNVHRSGLSS
jgi:hypothetical protein